MLPYLHQVIIKYNKITPHRTNGMGGLYEKQLSRIISNRSTRPHRLLSTWVQQQ